MLIILAVVLVVSGAVFAFFDVPEYAPGITWGLFVLVVVAGLIYINTGNRVKK